MRSLRSVLLFASILAGVLVPAVTPAEAQVSGVPRPRALEAGASLTIVHDAHDRQDFSYATEGTGLAPFVLDDDSDPVRANAVTFTGLAPGTYRVTQAAVERWRLVDVTCTGAATVEPSRRSVQIPVTGSEQITCTFRSAPDRPVVGAIRWDAWHDGPAGRAVEYTLGPAHWRDRLPWFGEVTGPETVVTRADTQAVADAEILHAAAARLDYFAFLWYDSNREAGSEDEGMMRGLGLYRTSQYRDLVKYTVVIDGQRLAMGAERGAVVRAMQDPNWVRVDGRPLVYVGLYSRPLPVDVAALRAESLAQGSGDPYVVYMTLGADSSLSGARYAAASGIDAVSSYIMGVSGSSGRPYADLAAGARRTWDQVSGQGVGVVPTVMTGWDPRPRLERPPYWGGSGPNWYLPPTPVELAGEFTAATSWARSKQAKAVVAYAWNEFDEGGWLSPTQAEGDERVRAVGLALSGQAAPTVSVRGTRVLEGDADSTTASVEIVLSGPAPVPVTVDWTTEDRLAQAGSDYAAANGTVTLAPGETRSEIAVTVFGDTVPEPDEDLVVRLRRPANAYLGPSSARVVIAAGDGTLVTRESFLSDLAWLSATNGFGPVKRDLSTSDRPLSIGGKRYTKGLGTHAPAAVEYAIAPGAARFVAEVGLDDACSTRGTAVFSVSVDGTVRYTSERLTNSNAPVPVSIDVSGGSRLTLRVTDGRDGTACDHADWGAARFESWAVEPPTTPPDTPPTTPPGTVPPESAAYLSDLAWLSATNGFGPVERDRTNGRNASGDGGPITIRGAELSKGLGVHAPSTVTYAVPSGMTRFRATVGVNDICAAQGSVVFSVLVDGVTRWTSGMLTGRSPSVDVDVPVTGASRLALRVTDGRNGAACDHADWGDARLQ